ncbi:transglycosylase SLT domain-containing protein [Nocardia huaxiensis]|uniref:Transglycosylase SLT domain-containing protein n=1 Tax=Nocardia huaxiensis TaxID=2755382 RepID=A0A7D6Z7Y2_9NOCA|nr:transglycosylase SLT domain-containing protein [Nocardia huaxiensis]QLY29168.1 transglycosylase SLT domain-containing protein [Nocardia huaxiensis]UFS97335.1 lytic transglycosylase domain-containing protein [Nocardia huaxiensis]
MPHSIVRGIRCVGKFAVVLTVATAMAVCAAATAEADCGLDCEDDRESAALSLSGLAGLGVGALFGLYTLTPRAIALAMVPPDQFLAFDAIIERESGWNTFAVNPVSGAYGLPQALPGHKMSTHGLDWPFNPVTQIRWAYDYMNQRYGSPNDAWVFWQANGWY